MPMSPTSPRTASNSPAGCWKRPMSRQRRASISIRSTAVPSFASPMPVRPTRCARPWRASRAGLHRAPLSFIHARELLIGEPSLSARTMPEPVATPPHFSFATLLWPHRADGAYGLLRSVILMALGTALLTLSAKVNLPLPYVPMTLQTLVVLVIGAVYGWRLGSATVIAYLAEGAIGFPVFAGPA